MRAVVVREFGDEQVLRCEEVPVPEPAAGEVRVRLEAAGVNPVETYIRAGRYAVLPLLPYTPGDDGAGHIDALGPGVQGLAPGQRVFVAGVLARRMTGTYAEYVVCDAQSVGALPENCPFFQGAGVGTPGLAATYALFSRAVIRPGETVLVHGATGGVGTLAVQLARRTGCTVLGTAGTPAGEAVLRELGAHHVFNHREDGYLERIRETVPHGPDVILEVLANVNLMKDLSLVALHGRIVVVGSRGDILFTPRQAMARDAAIHGLMVGSMPAGVFRENMRRLSAALENGLRVVVGDVFPLEKAGEAHAKVAQGAGPGKSILRTTSA